MALTYDRLVFLLTYDPKTGEIRNRIQRASNAKKGELSGAVDKDGYLQTQIDGKIYKNHRLAWMFMTGEMPELDIDHKDTVKGNNAWLNLMPTTKTLNNANQRKKKNNTSGYKGVTWDKSKGRWMAQIQVNKKFVYIGRFDDPAVAHAAYVDAAKKHFGTYARTE